MNIHLHSSAGLTVAHRSAHIGIAFIVLCGLALALTSCDSLEPLERNLPRDPGSEQFIPVQPTAITVDTSDLEPVLRWEPGSAYADGVVIERALSSEKEFEPIAVLPALTTMYRDTSGILALDTYYRVTSVKETAHGTNAKETTPVKVTFSRLQQTSGSNGPDLTRIIHLQRSAGLASHVGIRNIAEPDQWIIIKDATADQVTFDPGIYDFRAESFELVLLWMSDVVTLELDTVTFQIDGRSFYAPTGLDISFVDEVSVVVSWTPRSPFAERQIIRRRVGGVWKEVAELDASASSFEHDFEDSPHRVADYQVVAVTKGGEQAATQGTTILQIDRPVIGFRRAISESEVEMEFSIAYPNVRGFVIERAGPGFDYLPVARLPAHERTFVDRTLSSDVGTYRYRVRSLNSLASLPVTIHFRITPTLQSEASLGIHAVNLLLLSPNKDRLAVATTGAIQLVNLERVDQVFHLRDVTSPVGSIDFHPNGRLLAVTFPQQSRLEVWDVVSGELVRAFGVQAISEARFSPDGQILAGMYISGRLRIWHTSNWSQVMDYTAPSGIYRPFSITFAPVAKLMAFTNINNEIEIWRSNDFGKVMTSTRFLGMPYHLRYTPDGSRLIFTTQHNQMYRMLSSGTYEVLTPAVHRFAFHPNTNQTMVVGTSGQFGGEVIELDYIRGEVHSVIPELARVAAYHPDGRTVITGHAVGALRFWDVNVPPAWTTQ